MSLFEVLLDLPVCFLKPLFTFYKEKIVNKGTVSEISSKPPMSDSQQYR